MVGKNVFFKNFSCYEKRLHSSFLPLHCQKKKDCDLSHTEALLLYGVIGSIPDFSSGGSGSSPLGVAMQKNNPFMV